MLSDAELIATCMDGAKPGIVYDDENNESLDRDCEWWMLGTTGYENGDEPLVMTCCLDLDALHIVEAKLSDQQATKPRRKRWNLWNASAEEKIRALAEVLRESVEKGKFE